MTDAWTATAEKAAERARTLRPIAITLFAIGMAMIANDVVPVSRECFDVLIDGQRQFSALCVLQEVGPRLILAGPAIALVWALWEAQSYLKRVEDGAVWAPATMKLFGRIGECLIAAAVWSALFAPTLTAWVNERGGPLAWQLDAPIVTLAGLGIILIAIARVLGDVLTVAGQVKSDNDEIV